MAKYRKIVEAVQWTGDNIEEIMTFMEGNPPGHVGHMFKDADDLLIIYTPKGDEIARLKDFIVKGVQGEIYPCKPDIFAATYELVEE